MDIEEDVEVTWHHSLFCFVVDIKVIIKKDEIFVLKRKTLLRYKLILVTLLIQNFLLMVS